MKFPLRDYLTIALALLAIFLCGYGIGHLVGQRRANAKPVAPVPTEAWQDTMFDRLKERLDLRPEQEEAIREELSNSAKVIGEARAGARQGYQQELLDLHDRLQPLLDPEQADQLRKSKESLQRSLQSGVSSSTGK